MASKTKQLASALLAGAIVLVAPALVELAGAARRAVLEPGEDRPGGAATSRQKTVNHDAFSQFSDNIGFEGQSKFRIGNSIFRRLWVPAPASTDSADGLGPLYNARGCQSCHLKDGRGHTPSAHWPEDDSISMLLRLSVPANGEEQRRLLNERKVNSLPDPVYGGQLQDIAAPGLDAEGQIRIDYTELPGKFSDGTPFSLRKPAYSITDLKYGPLSDGIMISPRIAPQMIGLGLLEAIPEAVIRGAADPSDTNGDGISGRVNEVWSHETNALALGRFGWKAGQPSVRQQSAEAFAGDMGLSTPLVTLHHGDCTAAQSACLAAPSGASERHDNVEVGKTLFDLTVFYAQNLAVPPRRRPNDPEVLRGKAIFANIGCANCHTPSFTTGPLADNQHLAGQKIWPYTDMLLHDMGEGLADNRPEGGADGREWRTPPLWGIGLTQAVSRHTFFLHDGRARSLEEAILWHGGEAEKARENFRTLKKQDREALLAFIRSL